nr:hypothetical protein CFP56_24312 [Quercus suber]
MASRGGLELFLCGDEFIILITADKVQVKSSSHTVETIGVVDNATPESSTPGSPTISADTASSPPSKAAIIAALKAKKESEQHLITASNSGAFKRKKQKKRSVNTSKAARPTAEQTNEHDNFSTITILTAKRANRSQGEPPFTLHNDGGDPVVIPRCLWFGTDDLGRGVEVLSSRIANPVGERPQSGLLMSLLKGNEDEQDDEDRMAKGFVEQTRIRDDDDAEPQNRIEELP